MHQGLPGYKTTLGAGQGTDIESAPASDFIIIWGSNTLTTNVHAWPFFNAARNKGANQLTSQRLTAQGDTCAFHCSLVEAEPAQSTLS
jgi:hypothetical protein